MEEKNNGKQRQKIKLNKYGWLIIIILVLCVLGLSAIKVSSVAMRDVVPQFSGNAGLTASVTSVSNSASGPYADGAYLVPVGSSYTVSWTANADVLGNLAQIGTSQTYGPNVGITVQYPQIAVAYTMQAALKT